MKSVKSRHKQSHTHSHFQRSIIEDFKWGFHVAILVPLTIWLSWGLLCGPLMVDAAKKVSKVRCEKDSFGNNNCTCPDDPITERYVDIEAEHCEFYWLCHLSVAVKLQCDTYSAFHPREKECMPRNRIPKNICKPLVDCPVSPNKYVEDPNDCTKFFLCYFGKHFHWSCPEGEYFEPYKERCIPDRGQAEACIMVAKRNFFRKLGMAEKPPPVSHKALADARAYKQHRKG